MSESEKSQNDLNDFADALRSLVPLPSAVSRDELMFRAGRTSVECLSTANPPRRWLWPITTAACALLAAVIGLKIGQNHATIDEHLVQKGAPAADPSSVDTTPPTAVTSHRPATAYLLERNRILARGVDATPISGANRDDTSSEPSYFELRDGLLPGDRS